MNAQFAIYEALLQAKIPAAAARGVVEALEKDMHSNLATKQDLLHLTELMNAKLDLLSTRLESLETRLVLKLGGLMAALIGLLATAQALVN
jgi:hypothetical protein